jgi:hypothetical protein
MPLFQFVCISIEGKPECESVFYLVIPAGRFRATAFSTLISALEIALPR